MKINRAYKFRIYPNKGQRELLSKFFGCSRFIYNYFLRLRMDYYAEHKGNLSYYEMAKMLTQLKKKPEYEWLRETNTQYLQQSLKDLDKAFQHFFRRCKNGEKEKGYPRFKKKGNKQSFRVSQFFKIEDGKLIIPKMTSLKIRLHRALEGKPKYITIIKTPTDKYYASISCEIKIPEPEYKGNIIGIDFGLKDFITDSDGNKVESPKFLKKDLRKLRRLNRTLSRRKKGSENWKKARLDLTKQYEKITNRRVDFLHKLSLRLVCDNQTIYIEDLSIGEMIKDKRFAQAVQDAGWNIFTQFLNYKGVEHGCYIEKADKYFPSSKRCSNCGYINESLRLSDRIWICPECKTKHDRDHNAAINILKFGTAGVAGTYTPVETGVTRSLKQEVS